MIDFLSAGVVRFFRTTDNFQNGNSRAVIAKFTTTEDKSEIPIFLWNN